MKAIIVAVVGLFCTAAQAYAETGVTLSEVLVGIGDKPAPIAVKANKCTFFAKTEAFVLGTVVVTPELKVCGDIEETASGSSVAVKSEFFRSDSNNKQVNRLPAGVHLDISGWE